jgi:protein gp37
VIKSKIEWCDSTFNPVTGCLHDCPYCYARGIATRFGGCDLAPDGKTEKQIITLTERLKVTTKAGAVHNAAYPYGFTPTMHEYRLKDPSTRGFGEIVFVCSTADLFGWWVPDEWITKVFDACKAAEGHRYLFLTKNPQRYVQLESKGLLPELDTFWYGSTMDRLMADVFKSNRHNTFVSMEPILEPFPYPSSPEALRDNWIIMGAETGNRANKVVPERGWVEPYVNFCKENNIPVFMKDSMRAVWGEDIITEFPWGD